MNDGKPVFIIRKKPVAESNSIQLDEWLALISSSKTLQPKPPSEHAGINRFTKQPFIFRTGPGGAFFDGPRGRCNVEYHAGGLVIHGAAGHAEAIVAEIAAALGAAVQKYDPNEQTADPGPNQ
jgi:hypothetical protein